jgi:predicted O-methyltransferase YrrM
MIFSFITLETKQLDYMSKILEILNDFYDFSCEFDLKFESENQPEISINNYVSNFLSFLICVSNFSKCLEIGTLNGKSAMIMAKAVIKNNPKKNKGFVVFTIEKDEKNFLNAKRNFQINNLEKNILIYNACAKEILKSKDFEDQYFDFVFIDGDKASYEFYFEFAKNHLLSNGMIVLDNIFLHLLNPSRFPENSKIFKSLEKILNEIQKKEKYETIIVPYKRDLSEDAFALVKLKN